MIDNPQSYLEINWNPVEMLYLKRLKEAVVPYGMHTPFMKQMLDSWETELFHKTEKI